MIPLARSPEPIEQGHAEVSDCLFYIDTIRDTTDLRPRHLILSLFTLQVDSPSPRTLPTMSEQDIFLEVMRLVPLKPQNEITAAFLSAFKSPKPPISTLAFGSFVSDLKSEPKVRDLMFALELFRLVHSGDPGLWTQKDYRYPIPYVEKVKTYPDGTQAGFGADPRQRLLSDLLSASRRSRVARIAGPNGSATTPKAADAMKGSQASRTTGQIARNNALLGAGMTAVRDYKLLLKCEFTEYLAHVAISGGYSGTVAGISSCIDHGFFGNNTVVGVFVGSTCNVVRLVRTGDWERFGKSTGQNIVNGGAAWAGTQAGAWAGMSFGPVCVTVGGLIGGICGSAVAGWQSDNIPYLGGSSEMELEELKMFWKRFEAQMELRETLFNMQKSSPVEFRAFFSALRATGEN